MDITIPSNNMIEVSKEEFEEHLHNFPRTRREGWGNANEYYHIWKGKKERIGVVSLGPVVRYYIKSEVEEKVLKKDIGYKYKCITDKCSSEFVSSRPLDIGEQYCPRCSMRLQERSKYLAAHPDEDPDNPFNSNGFPKSFSEIGDIVERVRETVRWWLTMHYGNTGGTDSNINKLVKEVMRIYKFQEEQTNVKEVLDQ